MSNYEVDPNIKQILDLKNNKGVFPLTVDSAVVAHSPNGETTYLDSVVDYLYQQVTNKLRLYTEQDGTYTKGKAYPATMGVQNANNIHALQGTVNNYASILSALQQRVNAIDHTEDIVSINRTIQRLWSILTNLSEASEYSYQEIKFSDSQTLPPSDLDNTIYWKNQPMNNPQHLWLGIRTITIKRGEDGSPIITKGNAMVVPLRGPKGDKGERGERGENGTIGSPGTSYRPVLMYKWTDSRIDAPVAPTDPQNQGWTESPNNPEDENKYLWMTQNYLNMNNGTYINPTWSTPVCLSGEDGVGSDGTGIEFIFFRTNSINIIPDVNDLNAYRNGTVTQQGQFQTPNFPFIGYEGANIVSGNQWTDNPQGIELANKYEWASFRQSSNGEWDSFCEPFRWSMWGEDGIDGDGVEYIYYLCNDPNRWREQIQVHDNIDPRIWGNDSNYQNPEYIREGTGWTDEPQGVTESNMYEYVSSRKTKPKPGEPNKKIWDGYSQPVLWAKFGKDGLDGSTAEQGLSGPVVRFRGEYDSSIPGTNNPYINSSLNTVLSPTAIRYIDVVYVDANGQKTYYMVKPQQDGTRQPTTTPTNSEDWEEAVGYSFIAAEALYAHNAHIDNLSGYEFVVQDQNNYTVAGMTGGNVVNSVVNSNYQDNPVRIWAGSNATDNINLQGDTIPFKVFQNGKLKATNAQIKGDLSLDSLSLTGQSYYYNESSITLPQIDSTKHTVIFIITTSNATEVRAHSNDVLFALTNNTITTTSSAIALDKYKIYLAISVNDGGTNGWLIQNLNSLQIINNNATQHYSGIISTNSPSWDVTNDGQDTSTGSRPVIKLDLNKPVCTFNTIDLSSYQTAGVPSFSLAGTLIFKYANQVIATMRFEPKSVISINDMQLENTSNGDVIIKDLISYIIKEDGYYIEAPDSINPPIANYMQDNTYFQVQWGDSVNIPSGGLITVEPHITLNESFNYTTTTANYSNPVTTTTVSQNGFVVDKGSIVATDMPEGATVNTKDCIVFKDVTTDPNNEQYEVTNYGSRDIMIGGSTLYSGRSLLFKAATNAHIDFSDITTIDPENIYDTDPVEHGDPVNH